MDPGIIAAIIAASATIIAALIGLIKTRSRREPSSEVTERSRLTRVDEPVSTVNAETTGTITAYRVIGFDLDGTLLRGLEFSWTLVWNYLGFPKAVQKAGMRRYITRQTSYQEWCRWACEQFREKGLKRSDFASITKQLKVTNNFHEAIRILKRDGFILGIISGGIDVFIREKMPEAYDLFDYIFINELQFDSNGIISGVKATPYDFEGKAEALKKMCTDNGYSLKNSVFVGEGFNDEIVATQAALTIAYPPSAQSMRAAASLEIEEDDLLKVVSLVIR